MEETKGKVKVRTVELPIELRLAYGMSQKELDHATEKEL